MEQAKKVGIKVYGVIWIVLSLCFLASMPATLMMLEPHIVAKSGLGYTMGIARFGIVLNIIGIIMGIGLLCSKKWARNILFVLIAADLVSAYFVLVHVMVVYLLGSISMGGIILLQEAGRMCMKPNFLLFLVIAGFLISNLYYFTRPEVKDQLN